MAAVFVNLTIITAVNPVPIARLNVREPLEVMDCERARLKRIALLLLGPPLAEYVGRFAALDDETLSEYLSNRNGVREGTRAIAVTSTVRDNVEP